jgi:ferrochelatase
MSRYSSASEFRHDQAECSGILLTNLGTPAAPTAAAVRRYLAEFLWDPRVVERPRWLWWLVLHGIILRLRPRRAAKSYAKIWTEAGSPLLHISQQQAGQLRAALEPLFAGPVKVALAMRYGEPSIAAGLQSLRKAGARRILVLPLYPQYSATTTASTLDAVTRELQHWRWVPELRFVNHYHDHPSYIHALAASIQSAWESHGRAEKLLFSFHGLPQRCLDAGDPYFCECHKTARLVAQALQLQDTEWETTFQSRFGPEPWLQPYTDHTLEKLAKQGVRHVQIICPGFAADCLETLEEINMQNREIFLQAGGERFHYIPALNAEADHIQLMADVITQHAGDWLTLPPRQDNASERAKASGAKS